MATTSPFGPLAEMDFVNYPEAGARIGLKSVASY